VALKLIKAGMDTREVVARFQSERQALAMMDHPAIAKVYDAGSTPMGRPYFVMEYVPGSRVTNYADTHKLTTEQRLELFIRICEGVQHAHQKAIIHRDLKPSNILVSEVDGKPMPKIIDFGVAKATAPRLDPRTVFTQVGSIVGSLGYISPEQADSGGEDIDTRSDVYSLGVILYELLAGTLPHDFRKIAYDEMLRRLREDDVPKPSTMIRTLGGDSVSMAENRGTEPQTLIRKLSGDADAIALKALEKNRTRRYGSASELATDIGRYLRNEPVTAHTPSAGYRVRKYIRRHRVGVGMAAAALLLLIAFAVAQTVALRRITREKERADRIASFMTSIFNVSNPSQARGNSVTARELLDKASNNIETGLKNDPALKASMMDTMGEVYESLGLFPQAEPLLRQALETRQRVLGPRNRQTLETASFLVVQLDQEGRFPEAEKLARETLDTSLKSLGPADQVTLNTERRLGLVLQHEGRFGEAESLHRKVLAAEEGKSNADEDLKRATRKNLAIDLAQEGKFAEAEKTFREILDIDRRQKGPDSPTTLNDMNNLGACLLSENKYEESEKLYRESIEAKKRVLGPDHPDTLLSMGSLGLVLKAEKRYDEAEKLYRETLELKSKKLGDEHRSTLVTADNLAVVLTDEGKYPEADQLIQKTLGIEQRVLGPNHTDTLVTLQSLGALREDEKRFADAEKAYAEALERSRKTLGDDSRMPAEVAFDLARVQLPQGKRDQVFANLNFSLSHALNDKDRAALLGSEFDSLHSDPRWPAIAAKDKKPDQPKQ
jgi:serine/threonine protein kinase/TolA-binding protein